MREAGAVRTTLRPWRVAGAILVAAGLAAFGGHDVLAQANLQGQWRTLPLLMPINPVHIAVTHTGNVLVVAGSGNVVTETNFRAAVWDLAGGTIVTQPVGWDMFCNAMIALPDGRLLVNGGTLQYDPFHGELRNSVFDPLLGTFTDVESMAHGRWYPTVTALGDGLARSDTSTGLVYICNPNNPTGTLTHPRDLEAFIRQLPETTSVLIDEAYHHYAGASSDSASFLDRPIDDDRVIVSRTFSTIFGLAGLRIGYAVASPRTARQLAARGLPENVNVVAAKAAVAALDDAEYVRLSVARNTNDRQEFFNQCHARMLKPIDSVANFVMMDTGASAVEIVEHFRTNNVLISPPIPGFDRYIRVSLGTQADMSEFWRAWDLLPARQLPM